MGKRLIHQRRGRGTPAHRVASHRFKDKIQYRAYDDLEKEGSLKGKVVEIIHDPARTAPIALVKFENGEFQHQSVSVTLYHLLKSLKVLQFTILKTDQETEVVS